jgi:hypothetical protein
MVLAALKMEANTSVPAALRASAREAAVDRNGGGERQRRGS